MNINPQQAGAWFLRLLAVAGVAIAAIDPNNLPASYRSVLTIASAVILAVDRYVADPSTGTPPPPTSSTPTVPPTPPV